jgi:NAD(P)-dependent dehydrogenase (short-subunit alcohol dehydrogenase family)
MNHNLHNKTVLITGSTSGIGLETAKAFIKLGAKVIMGTKTNIIPKAARKISQHENAQLFTIELDDLDQIKQSVSSLSVQFPSIDILINNAGIMEPNYNLTKQGFESQFGVNYLGHFALTIEILKKFPNIQRVVTVSSLTALNSTLQFNTFKDHSPYCKRKSYGQSKLANLIFSLELNKRLGDSGSRTISVAAHPGYSRTNLQRHVEGVLRKTYVLINKYLRAQSAKNGALPILFAANDPLATGNEYYVPNGELQLKGNPIKVEHPAMRIHSDVASLLWKYSETETGITL